MRTRSCAGAALATVLLFLAVVSTAAPTFAAADPPHRTRVRYRPRIDVPLTLAAMGAWGVSQLLEPQLAPRDCRWCNPDGLDLRLRSALVWRNPSRADALSSVLAFGALPAALVALDFTTTPRSDWASDIPIDLLVMAESASFAMVADQAFKLTVGRERPFVWGLPASVRAQVPNAADNNVSFYSGHTALAFSLAVSAGVLASERKRRWAPLVWAIGLPLSAAIGYLRIAADKHWTTDALAGAASGAAIGALVPLLLHPAEGVPEDRSWTVRLVPAGAGLAAVGTF